MRGPGQFATDKSVRDRVRRLPADTAYRREAKRLVKEDHDLLGAMEMLLTSGDIRQEHIDAFRRWLRITPDDLV